MTEAGSLNKYCRGYCRDSCGGKNGFYLSMISSCCCYSVVRHDFQIALKILVNVRKMH